MRARAWRSDSKRARTVSRVEAGPNELERHPAADGLLLLGEVDDAHASDPQRVEDAVRANLLGAGGLRLLPPGVGGLVVPERRRPARLRRRPRPRPGGSADTAPGRGSARLQHLGQRRSSVTTPSRGRSSPRREKKRRPFVTSYPPRIPRRCRSSASTSAGSATVAATSSRSRRPKRLRRRCTDTRTAGSPTPQARRAPGRRRARPSPVRWALSCSKRSRPSASAASVPEPLEGPVHD